MNKILLLIFFISFTSYSQWKREKLKDEFGDETVTVVDVNYVVGKFSNSATSNERSILKISIFDNGLNFENILGRMFFEIWEYNSNEANLSRKYNDLFVSFKDNSGKVFTMNILPSEYSENNRFLIVSYVNPTKEIKNRTVRENTSYNTYTLIKPYYDIHKILYEKIMYTNELIKIYIETEYGSSYNFSIRGINKTKSQEQIEKELAIISDYAKEEELKLKEKLKNSIKSSFKVKY